MSSDASGSIELMPIEERQTQAIVRLFAVSEQKRVELTRFTVSPLPRPDGRRPILGLRARIDPDKRLRLRLDVENRLYDRREIPVRRYLGGPSPVAVTLAVLLLLLLGAAAGYLAIERAGADTAREETAEASGDEETASRQARAAADEGAKQAQPAADEAPQQTQAAPKEAEAAPSASDAEAGPASAETDQALLDQSWSVYFRPDSPMLTSETKRILDRVADELADAGSIRLELTGHTALFGTERGRIELSRERAARAAAYLDERLPGDAVSLQHRGVGGRSPVTEDPDRQHLNRRVEIRVEEQEGS